MQSVAVIGMWICVVVALLSALVAVKIGMTLVIGNDQDAGLTSLQARWLNLSGVLQLAAVGVLVALMALVYEAHDASMYLNQLQTMEKFASIHTVVDFLVTFSYSRQRSLMVLDPDPAPTFWRRFKYHHVAPIRKPYFRALKIDIAVLLVLVGLSIGYV